MAKRSSKTRQSETKTKDLVVVAFADSLEQAQDYESLLKNNDIPAIIKEQSDSEELGTDGFAVMAPEEYIDEAHVVIESQDLFDDLDITDENEEEDFFDENDFDQDF